MEFVNVFTWVNAVGFDYDISLGGWGGGGGGRGKFPSATESVGYYSSSCPHTATAGNGGRGSIIIGAGGGQRW